MVDEPLPGTFRIRPAPTVVRLAGDGGRGGTLQGGSPRRVVRLESEVAEVVDALLDGSTVQDAGDLAGPVARRLVEIGMARAWPPPGGPGPADVAVVIPAHDAEELVVRVLDGLPDVGRVVVVDDRSTDGTAAAASTRGATVVANAGPAGPAAARNAGAATVDEEIVAFVDADAALVPGWLPPLLAHFADPTVGAVAPRVRAPDDGSVLGGYEAVAGPLDLGDVGGSVGPDDAVPFVSTTTLLVRRSAWEAVGGFAEDLRFGEDVDFVWRLAACGTPAVYEPSVTVWHPHRRSLGAHVTNRFRYGTAGGALAARHGGRPGAPEASALLTAAFVLGLLGARRSGAVLVGAATVDAMRRLREVGLPLPDAAREAARATSRQGRGLLFGISRPWSPFALALAAGNRRARLPVAAALLARAVTSRRRAGGAGSVRNWVLLRSLDDLAFSAGVLHGSLTARDLRPLLPSRPRRPVTSRSVLGEEIVFP